MYVTSTVAPPERSWKLATRPSELAWGVIAKSETPAACPSIVVESYSALCTPPLNDSFSVRAPPLASISAVAVTVTVSPGATVASAVRSPLATPAATGLAVTANTDTTISAARKTLRNLSFVVSVIVV
jgi:hypothetical protein